MPFPSLPLIWATVNTSTPVYILGPLMQSVAKTFMILPFGREEKNEASSLNPSVLR